MKISYYQQDCTLEYQQELTNDNMGNTDGMIVRYTIRNGDIYEGYFKRYATGIHLSLVADSNYFVTRTLRCFG